MRAHGFAGLHIASTDKLSPEDFLYTFEAPLTLFEGMNGSGKTSLLNAIIWALTGEILRPQRQPESAKDEYLCELAVEEGNEGASELKLTPIAPLPNPELFHPKAHADLTDTWVELTLADDAGTAFVVRREQKWGAKGKPTYSEQGFDALALAPATLRTGTIMPGLLPFIQIGGASKLGEAIAELTGMTPLTSLASHAERVKKKIDGDLTRDRQKEIADCDVAYRRSRADLDAIIDAHAAIKFGAAFPESLSDANAAKVFSDAKVHFEGIKAKSLADAKQVLGESFNPENSNARRDLEDNIGPAMEAAKKIVDLPSAARLGGLGKVAAESLNEIKQAVAQLLIDGQELAALAAEPTKAARLRLYALLADWIGQHDVEVTDDLTCMVCGGALTEVADPVTGKPVIQHLRDANEDARLVSQPLARWAKQARDTFIASLPSAIHQEINSIPYSHPGQLIEQALTVELFENRAFSGVLNALKENFTAKCKTAIDAFSPLSGTGLPNKYLERNEFKELRDTLIRVDFAVRFSEWRQSKATEVSEMFRGVLGSMKSDDQLPREGSLLDHMHQLRLIVQSVEPVNQAIVCCGRMIDDLAKQKKIEKRLGDYKKAGEALNDCKRLGSLVDEQVTELQGRLHKDAVRWRNHIYQGAFPSTAMELVDSRMETGGKLGLFVGTNGIAAPAQHVSNASALRASLVGFYLAYWHYLLRTHGGLRILLLDDPQELLDGDNKERLANSTAKLVESSAQLVMTTHDKQFARKVMIAAKEGAIRSDVQYVHPATKFRGTIFLSPSVESVQSAHDEYEDNEDDEKIARHYACECRIFIEARLGDLFDDAAFPAATISSLAPSLGDHIGKLRSLISTSSNELYRSKTLAAFCNDSALESTSATYKLLNKAHHGEAQSIRPTDVKAAHADLERLRRSVEKVHEEFRLYRRRAPLQNLPKELPSLEKLPVPKFDVFIQPNLAAFTLGAAFGESQEVSLERITSKWFEGKACFLIRTSNLGFTGPPSSIAIVNEQCERVEDRQLVIARRGKEVYARRILRAEGSDMITLAAETPDPRKSPPSMLLPEVDVGLHRIVGMLFEGVKNPPKSKQEAASVDGAEVLASVRSAYRIKEDSAIPLALEGQIALGGKALGPGDFDSNIGKYVALHLDTGTSLFKRIGERLPKPLDHLRRFETIGGFGVSDVVAVDSDVEGFPRVLQAVLVIGILYTAV